MSRRPLRATRGKRYRRVLAEEHDADEEFWGQEFFKEDDVDDVYLTESSKDSVADSDFDDPDSHSEDDDAVQEPLEKPRKKRLLPPGTISKKSHSSSHKRQKIVPTDPLKSFDKEDTHEGTIVELRKSTLLRRTVAEEERRLQELHRIRRPKIISTAPTMRSEEFLKDIAEVEASNLASLNELRAFEEASRKRAIQTKKGRRGPSITIRSRRSGDVEKTTMELIRATRLPKWLRRRPVPKKSEKEKCVITGLPAKYRDPKTKLPYATIEAFQKIRASVQKNQQQ